MGVMACQREKCDHVMCDHTILGVYICNTCWEELQRLKATWPATMRGDEVAPAVRAFMATHPGQSAAMSVDEAFKRLTEMR